MEIWDDKPISYFDIGMTRGLQFAAFALQANKGDCNWEEPSFINFAKLEIYNNWQKMRGMSQETAMRIMVRETDIEFAKFDKLPLLENPNRPGPDYYKDCKLYNWVNDLVDKHKKFIQDSDGNYEYYTQTEDEQAWSQALKLN